MTLSPPNWWLGTRWHWRDLLEQASEPLLERFTQSQLQSASAVRFRMLTLALADQLLDPQGHLDPPQLKQVRKEITGLLCPLKSELSGEYLRLKHIERILGWLESESLRKQFDQLAHGSGLAGVDQLILLSLRIWPGMEQLSPAQLNERHVRIALLSAWLSYLRQSVGSCFATAPAIWVLTNAPEFFLQDMAQLLGRGCLTRTLEGQELTAPACEDLGLADLRKRVQLERNVLQAPGLLFALQTTGLFHSSGSLEQDLIELAQQLEPIAGARADEAGLVSALDLIEGWICQALKLSLDLLREYQQRPERGIPSGTLQMSSSSSSKLERAAQALAQAQQSFCLLTDHPLLRMWEFTLASFSDTRQEGCLWSLFTSIGMNPDQEGGLAHCLYQILEEKVSYYHQKCSELQPSCDNMAYQLQHAMTRLQNANEREVGWLRSECQGLKAELDSLQSEQGSYHRKAEAFAQLYNLLLDQYSELFGHYFQQIYDPQLKGSGPYEDAPAGFRLVFKAGRSHAATWTPIFSGAQFIDALARFLTVTEQELAGSQLLASISDDLPQIVTLLIQHVRSQKFLASAFARLSHGLGRHFEELSEANPTLSPWAYVSGGTMKTLVSHYFGRSQEPEQRQSWFHDVRELWVFLIDLMRDMPADQAEFFLQQPQCGLLMHSPSHAFIFLPGHPTFAASWKNQVYPYTWVRDFYEHPLRDLYSNCTLTPAMQRALLAKWGTTQPLTTQQMREIELRGVKPHEFRDRWLQLHGASSWLRLLWQQKLDSWLLRSLPLLELPTALRRVEEFCEQSELLRANERSYFAESWKELLGELGSYIGADELVSSFYGACKRVGFQGYWSHPTPFQLRSELARFGLGPLLPIFFADSNWDHYHFAFVLNPGADQLEIWRMRPDSLEGSSMEEWAGQIGGSEQLWGIYSQFKHYPFHLA